MGPVDRSVNQIYVRQLHVPTLISPVDPASYVWVLLRHRAQRQRCPHAPEIPGRCLAPLAVVAPDHVSQGWRSSRDRLGGRDKSESRLRALSYRGRKEPGSVLAGTHSGRVSSGDGGSASRSSGRIRA